MLNYMAYFFVHSFATLSCFTLSSLYILAISGTIGSYGLGSDNNDVIDISNFDIVNAGLHWSCNISSDIDPFKFILQWYIFDVKFILGGLCG